MDGRESNSCVELANTWLVIYFTLFLNNNQTHNRKLLSDLGMQINQAMFVANGRCGYVLKPERMCTMELAPTKSPTQTLEIEVKINLEYFVKFYVR